MNETKLKYTFSLFSAFLLILMLLQSRNAGISCDEVLHYQHSLSVYNYYASHGKDLSALNTPETYLKYYGQSYDNLVTILIKWFNIEDIYGFRHIMSSIAGWLVILITALFAIWLDGYRPGLIVLFLFAVSPTFIGHSQNNLKDVPFALTYIAGTFFILRILFSKKVISKSSGILLVLSIAFSISLRAGGLLLICYIFLFFFIYYTIKFFQDGKLDFYEIRLRLIWISGMTIVGFFLSTILWPYALQDPFKNIIESYRMMAHFPGTFRQLFEGKMEWSDYMPWYYLIKSMIITIPVIVLAGLLIYLFVIKKIMSSNKILKYVFIVFTVVFPVIFVIFEKSNLYSSWRQFLFVYPGIILISSIGFHCLFDILENNYIKAAIIVLMIIFAVHPLTFMNSNRPYFYLYYNQLVGGLKGALGKYETDYYYVSQTEASDWLINYLKQKGEINNIKVKAIYSIQWLFRDYPEIETSYFRFEERSLYDWDYAIVVNRYIPPFQLNKNMWPPKNAIHIVYADQVPLCAVLERKSKNDYYGYETLKGGRTKEAISYFEEALKTDDKDEMIFYNFAVALYNDGQTEKADSVLKKGLEINPDFEPILMYLGNIAKAHNNRDEAIKYYEKLINVNRKYFEAYVELAGLIVKTDLQKARGLLRACIRMSPRFKPAIVALADTYRGTNPQIAKKYDDLVKTIK